MYCVRVFCNYFQSLFCSTVRLSDLHQAQNFHVFSQSFKGGFLEFQMYYNFANLFSTLSESTFYKEISKL